MTSVSNFFARDAMLKRQARITRARKVERRPTLNIIPEEDELRTSSSSRSPSPVPLSSITSGKQSPSIKARRRYANISDIRVTQDATFRDDNDLSPIDDTLLTAPRPAPRPPTTPSSPQSSPDSFHLTFTEKSFTFPHPPEPTFSSLDRSECYSPTPSISSLSSSPCSPSGTMPLTPSTSDDESIPSRTFHHCATIRPLVIHKHHPRPVSPSGEIFLSPSLPQPFKNVSEVNMHATLSPSFLESESSESDPESDSEWYTREFSKIISLRSPLPPSFPLQQSCRPDSMSITSDVIVPTTTVNKRRVSKTFQPSVEAAPRRRNSKTRSIPKYPPPPVPPIPAHLRSSVSPPSSPAPAVPQNVRRPPPRSSIPADCVIDLYLDEDEVSNDSSSAFSFTMYEIDLGERELGRDSPASAYSQPSFEEQGQEVSMDNVKFELDYPSMLPLSLPGTPLDLEADIARGLERLHNAEDEAIFEQAEFVIEEEAVQEDIMQQQPLIIDAAPVPEAQEVVDDVFSPHLV
ncbi:hypothetical protein NLJ89_g11023 [Agrocybe chaxingu]|uniref:Uncharacterized protein n=1 Tax=Agrocybe chaxingu TaxID=84603 RepID=A0A9W8MND5_9AGAR|nr:hypothetical protein NLJ89_g11023 [Agrocybe chaxingu]